MSTKIGSRHYILGLDIVRLWAASSVAFFHLGFWSWASPQDLPYRAAAGTFHLESLAFATWFGWSGVETFFVISGFVICASAQHSTAYRFFCGRVSRLYPAVWICASITAIVSLTVGLASPTTLAGEYVRSVLIAPTGPYIDSVYRTLAVEGAFYTLILTVLLARRIHHIEPVAIILGLGSLSFWCLGAAFDLQHTIPAFLFNFGKYGIFFSLGMAIWTVEDKGLSYSRIATVVVLMCCGATEVYLVAVNMKSYFAQAPALVAVGVWLTSVGAIIASVRYKTSIAGLIGRKATLIRAMGLATYPLYLLHDVVGAVILRTADQIGAVAAFGLALFVSYGMAHMVVGLEPVLRKPLRDSLAALEKLAIRIAALRHAAVQPDTAL